MTTLDRLAALLRAEGGLLAAAVGEPGATDEDPALGEVAAAGPRAAGRAADYALLVEAIREGYLLHYGVGRVVRTPDPDLALLVGDRLYALGLSRLAKIGDLEGVAVLADLISECAQAHAEDRPEDAEAIWRRGAHAIGHGVGDRPESALELGRAR